MNRFNKNKSFFILQCSIDNTIYLRQYDDSTEGFTDYELRHNDLEITITDDDFSVRETDDGFAIDYSLSTLGTNQDAI